MEEGIIEKIYNELDESNEPIKQLLYLYTVLFDGEVNQKIIIALRRMVKLFGRKTVFFALLDFANWNDRTNIYKGLYYLCSKRLETKSSKLPSDDLSSRIKFYEKLAKKRGKRG